MKHLINVNDGLRYMLLPLERVFICSKGIPATLDIFVNDKSLGNQEEMLDGDWYSGEKDAVISHGCAEFLKERLMDQSDAYTIHVCRACKVPAIHNFHTNESTCNLCNQSSDVATVRLPYACKLLFQELMSQGIHPKIAIE